MEKHSNHLPLGTWIEFNIYERFREIPFNHPFFIDGFVPYFYVRKKKHPRSFYVYYSDKVLPDAFGEFVEKHGIAGNWVPNLKSRIFIKECTLEEYICVITIK